MPSKLVTGSVILIAIGLVLVILGDPAIGFVIGAGNGSSTRTFTFGTVTTTITGSFTGTFTRGTNFTFPSNFTFPGGFRSSSGGGRLTTANLETLAGISLVAAGLLLEVFSVFLIPKPKIPAGS